MPEDNINCYITLDSNLNVSERGNGKCGQILLYFIDHEKILSVPLDQDIQNLYSDNVTLMKFPEKIDDSPGGYLLIIFAGNCLKVHHILHDN